MNLGSITTLSLLLLLLLLLHLGCNRHAHRATFVVPAA